MTASEFITRTWDMILSGEVVDASAKKADEMFFEGVPIVESMGGAETVNGGVEAINAIINGNPTGAVQGTSTVVAGKVKALKPIVEAIRNALKANKNSTDKVLTVDGQDLLKEMRKERSNLKTGTLDNKQKDRELYENMNRTKKTLEQQNDRSSRFKAVRKAMEIIKDIGEWF